MDAHQTDLPENLDRPRGGGALKLPAGVKPFFEGGGVTIVPAEDCLDVLPRLPAGAAAAAVTDPPYCSGGTSAAERARDPAVKYCHDGDAKGRPSFRGDHLDQRAYKYWCTLWLRALRRAVRESGYCLAFIDWRQLPTMTDAFQAGGFVWRGVVPWNKGRGARAPHKGYFRHQCEYVVWGTNGPCRRRDIGPFEGCISESVRQADKFHMTGKPTALLEQLVVCAEDGGLVIDPFAGSGTTPVACVLTGRRCLAIEQSEAYCEVAARRVEAALAGRPITPADLQQRAA